MSDKASGWNRRFLVGGAAATTLSLFYVAAVTRGALKACSYEDFEVETPFALQSLIRIGNSYLNEHTKNGELDPLDEALLDETERSSADIIFAVQRRLLSMERQIRDEFERCETVICDGWVLAKSEARLCAMIAAHAARL
jgi:hypothetical protein